MLDIHPPHNKYLPQSLTPSMTKSTKITDELVFNSQDWKNTTELNQRKEKKKIIKVRAETELEKENKIYR